MADAPKPSLTLTPGRWSWLREVPAKSIALYVAVALVFLYGLAGVLELSPEFASLFKGVLVQAGWLPAGFAP